MEKDQKLVDALCAVLREAGYDDMLTQQDGNGVLVTASRGRAGAALRLAPDMHKVPKRTEHGASEGHDLRDQVHLAPAVEGLLEQLRGNPDMARSLKVPEAHRKHVR